MLCPFIPRDPYHNFPLQNAWHHHWFIHNWFCLICYRGKVLGNLVHIWAVSVCVDHVSTCLCMCAYACVPIRKVLRSQHHRNLHPDWSLVQLLALQCGIVADGVVDYNAENIFGAIMIVLASGILLCLGLGLSTLLSDTVVSAWPCLWWINQCHEQYQLCEGGEDVVVYIKDFVQ